MMETKEVRIIATIAGLVLALSLIAALIMCGKTPEPIPTRTATPTQIQPSATNAPTNTAAPAFTPTLKPTETLVPTQTADKPPMTRTPTPTQEPTRTPSAEPSATPKDAHRVEADDAPGVDLKSWRKPLSAEKKLIIWRYYREAINHYCSYNPFTGGRHCKPGAGIFVP